MNRTQKSLALGGLAIVALAATAIAASYTTRSHIESAAATSKPQAQQAQAQAPVARHHAHPQQVAAAQPAPCNDSNIVGTVGGGLAGALIGNQFGHGSGKTIATVGGAAGGAYLGNQYIPTRGAACQ